jgi:hypothetical protein
MKFYIIRYSHRHGHDVWPHFSDEEPAEADIIEELEAAGQWEGEKRDEYVEIYGPFETPEEKQR